MPHRQPQYPSAPCPDADPRPYRKIATFPTGGESLFVALHSRVQGFLTHYLNQRTYPCRQDPNRCEGCRVGAARRWEGFVGAVSWYVPQQWLLKVPAGAYRNCPVVRELSEAGTLRGMLLKCFRIGQRVCKTSPARLVVSPCPKAYKTPAPFDFDAALCRWWGLTSIAELYVASEFDLLQLGNEA